MEHLPADARAAPSASEPNDTVGSTSSPCTTRPWTPVGRKTTSRKSGACQLLNILGSMLILFNGLVAKSSPSTANSIKVTC
eukprot:scaffold11535_cov135-Isochrysis_galbana.AAC.5